MHATKLYNVRVVSSSNASYFKVFVTELSMSF